LQVLRVDPQHAQGRQLLRDTLQALEMQKRKQQALQLLSQAEEALNNKDLDSALKYAEQGLQLDVDNAELRSLLSKVMRARVQGAKYCEALARAERARQSGSLEKASQALAEAIAILPIDTPGRALKARIEADIEERSRKEKDGQAAKRQFALAVNRVERAIADARLQMYLNQPREAWEILEKASQEASQIPFELRSQLETLAQQLRKNLSAQGQEAPPLALHDEQKEHDESTAAEFDVFHSISRSQPQPTSRQTTLYPNRSVPDDTFQSHADAPAPVSSRYDASDVPEELGEFLPPPPRRGWGRPAVWLSIGTIALAFGIYWVAFDRKPETHSPKPPVPQETSQMPVAPDVTYAEVDAGPWGTVKEVRSMDGQTVRLLNDQTPLRVELPTGQYKVSIEGPNGEKRVLQVEVPERGGNSYFVLFHKADIQRIINAK
jgi:tetratricopeptide (TPR) repeat protein